MKSAGEQRQWFEELLGEYVSLELFQLFRFEMFFVNLLVNRFATNPVRMKAAGSIWISSLYS